MASRSASLDPRAEKARGELKAAAWRLTLDRRVETISVSDIVRLSGVSRPAFYLHFTDRDDAIVAAVVDRLDEAVDVDAGPQEVIAALMGFVVDNMECYRNLYPSLASQRCAEVFRSRLRPQCEEIVVSLRSGVNGSGSVSADTLTTFLLGGFMEILAAWAASPGAVPPDEQASTLLAGLTQLAEGRGTRR
ncbi:TetR/AcrR family transcriptional regulator [Gordonia oryzae]|uniref:TetR/AcrR family transcriptional regulator n=1 Tax=Gordonia oryzae TaxID=2487349 RepID=UPI001613841F|nr:TetR/AcrR family transcriptional regulator [Gordonia oryzae]